MRPSLKRRGWRVLKQIRYEFRFVYLDTSGSINHFFDGLTIDSSGSHPPNRLRYQLRIIPRHPPIRHSEGVLESDAHAISTRNALFHHGPDSRFRAVKQALEFY